jgi:putative RecB family exonuclease
VDVPFTPPRSLSPSKVTSFRDCALAFRFNAIERLPDEPTVWTVKGTLVHRVLEQLFWRHEPGRRTPQAAESELSRAWDRLQGDLDFVSLGLSPTDAAAFRDESGVLVAHYFELEDPNEITPVGVELTLDARVGDMRLRGIIDRLDRTPDGELVVIDYKTGRAPSPAFEQSKLIGVQIYALLCLEVLGRAPVQVKLLHLKEPTAIIAEPTEQTLRGQRLKTAAVWSAIERACRNEDFRPRTSPLCNYCRFQAFCPAYGGNPEDAARVLGGAGEVPDAEPVRVAVGGAVGDAVAAAVGGAA